MLYKNYCYILLQHRSFIFDLVLRERDLYSVVAVRLLIYNELYHTLTDNKIP